MARFSALIMSALLMAGCFAKVSATNQLQPGMSQAQVRQMLGEPSQTQFVANKIVWKYSLHQPWAGFKPYYLVFDNENQSLIGWAANEEEFARNQAAMLQTWGMVNQTFPAKRKVEIEIKHR